MWPPTSERCGPCALSGQEPQCSDSNRGPLPPEYSGNAAQPLIHRHYCDHRLSLTLYYPLTLASLPSSLACTTPPRAPLPPPPLPRFAVGQCQSSQDGQYGLLYQCVQAQTTVLQLACPGDFQCAGNTANGDCSVNRFEASDCVFSSSVGQYVQITCSAGTVVPTLTGGPARQLRSDNGEIDVRREFIDEASWEAMEAMSVTPLGGDDVTF